MSQSVFSCGFLILLIYTVAAQRSNEQTLCGPAELKGPLNEDGESERLLSIVANLSSGPIEIKCQLNRTYPIMDYNLKLKIYYTIDGEVSTLGEHDPYSDHSYRFDEEEEGNIINYAFYIAMDKRLHKSVVTCGAGYEISPGAGHNYCFTGSAALIKIEDYDSCDPPATVTPTTPNNPTTTSRSMPTSTPTPNNPTTTSHSMPTSTPTLNNPTTTSHSMPTSTPTETPVPPVTDEIIAINKSNFFSVVGIVIFVGVVLLVANIIQLWVIITIVKNRRAAIHNAVNISATNSVALEHLDIEIEHDIDSKPHGNNEVDQHGITSEENSTMISNITATERVDE